MFDQRAAQNAARSVLAQAPVIEGGDGSQLAVPIKALVDAIVTTGNPDALIIPTYDPELAMAARYRLGQDTDEGGPGATMSMTAHAGTVAIAVHSGGHQVLAAGMVGADAMWLLGLAACSAAQASRDMKEGA